MTRYGFLIDQDTCIGCHACTVACKSEHSVPLGVNRTWLKYVEKGKYPDTRRYFSVLRCNHCDAAPCVTICPTGALFRRPDGIVDFDTSACIGCKSCMNACPYDAIYIDPDEHTAQKCNYCAHRIEVGLEPACVIVCPTQSIVAGDLDDPGTRIARMLARHDVHVRAPEQGTRPKLFYKGSDSASLVPTSTAIAADGMIWAETTPSHPTVPDGAAHGGAAAAGPAREVDARTAYTTAHPMAWRGMVSAYLVTKSMAAGALMVAALLVLLGHAGRQAAVGVLPPVLAGAFTALTGALLVADLKQPRRFHYLLTRPNWTSWLTRGAVILGLYAAVQAAWFVAGLAGAGGAVKALAGPGLVLGAATAGDTAYLFGQCEGRDFWQTPVLLPILLAQAVVAGASLFLVADLFMAVPEVEALRWALLAGVAAV
ncbi:MAG TPA: 4Fe-4S dicluster domain-containing protein, partial [Acidimicrobiales bacterium]|nr:4Fe-4S dicluster domain-containing protein [Acidimicrobiales bacterium]